MRLNYKIVPCRAALMLCLLVFSQVAARGQDQRSLKPTSVGVGQGAIEFRNMRLSFSDGPEIRGDIVNRTGTDWPQIEFSLLLKGFQYKTGRQRDPNCSSCVGKIDVLVEDKSKPIECIVRLGFIEGIKGEQQEFERQIRDDECSVPNQCKFELIAGVVRRYIEDGKCATPNSAFDLGSLDIKLVKSVSREDALKAQREKKEAGDAARQKVLQKEAEERKAQSAREEAGRAAARTAAEARRRELAQLPKLTNGNETVPVAADEKCLSQTVDAINEGGLESRKKISELLAYRCFFTVKTQTPVRVLKKGWKSSLVSVADGEHEGQSGWVSSDWLQQ
jgi:hypothetical protein